MPTCPRCEAHVSYVNLDTHVDWCCGVREDRTVLSAIEYLEDELRGREQRLLGLLQLLESSNKLQRGGETGETDGPLLAKRSQPLGREGHDS